MLSAHHGDFKHQNELVHALKLLDEFPSVKYVEIDFVCWNGNYISSHDYDENTIKNGATLKEWLIELVKRNVVLWMDVKDTNTTILGDIFSQIDGELLFCILKDVSKTLLGIDLKEKIIISSQYVHAYERICRANEDKYTIAHDLPNFYSYVMESMKFNPLFKSKIQKDISIMLGSLRERDVACIDCSFFETKEELIQVCSKTKVGLIILYSLNVLGEVRLRGKKVVYQHDLAL